MKRIFALPFLGQLFVWLLLIIFGGIVLQAPISVGFGVLFPGAGLLIKAWAEILMIFAALLLTYLLYKKQRFDILREPLMLLVAGFAVLHILLIGFKFQGSTAVLTGLIVDLRFLLFFGLVYAAVKLYPSMRRPFLVAGVIGAAVVLGFAMLQVFVLPPDILKYLGYSDRTIQPYLTVDLNASFVRINSTLRGPNPLGAYAAMVLALLVARVMNVRLPKKYWQVYGILLLFTGAAIALWASYSRSALIGAVIAVLVAVSLSVGRRAFYAIWSVVLAAFVVGLISVTAFSHNSFIQNVIFHSNPAGGSATKSDSGHISSLAQGMQALVHEPLGTGVGSTGSASLYTNSPTIIENQYLFVAHESGWLGLALFVVIFALVMWRLYERRRDWLAIGVLASGVCLAVIGVLLPVFVDDTVSIVWWGLAGLVVAQPVVLSKGKYERNRK